MSTGFDAIGPVSDVSLPSVPDQFSIAIPPVQSAEPHPPLQRVLHLINGEHFAGAERVQDLLAARLPAFGYQVGFACLKPNRFPKDRQTVGAALHELKMTSRFDFRVVRKVIQLCDEHGYELLHAHTPRAALVARLVTAQRRLPWIYHVHSPTSRDSTRPLQNRINSVTERLSISNADRLITVSQSLAHHMRGLGYGADVVRVVPNGVPRPIRPRAIRRPTSAWTLGTIALFRPRKGTEVLIAALAHLRDAGFDVRLRAVGTFESDEHRQSLLDCAHDHHVADLIDWVGFQKDVNAQLERMDLFVLPSLFGEGMPMVVLEAMAMGVPVISTDVEGIPEAIRDGVDGCIARVADAADLARAAQRVMVNESLWSDMHHHAIARHHERFSDESMARGVAEVYGEVLAPVGQRR